MENDGIRGDESKVKYVGNYFIGKAWYWFGPIMRERNTKPKDDSGDRSRLGSRDAIALSVAMVMTHHRHPVLALWLFATRYLKRRRSSTETRQRRSTGIQANYATEFAGQGLRGIQSVVE
jgi:hypothetical protein